MTKKKTSRASRKKNRKGAAGKAASTTGERGVNNGKQDTMSGNADRPIHILPFHSMNEAAGSNHPFFSKTVIQNANHRFHGQSLGSKEQERLLKKMDAIYNKDLRKWVLTLYTMMATGELYSLGPYMSVVFDKLVFLVQNAISATKKKDVLLDGLHLHMTVNLMLGLMHVMDTDEEEVLDLLECFATTAKAVSDTHYASSGAGYVLCHSMCHCSLHIRQKKGDDAKTLIMIAKSGILEQVLLHIHLSWSPLVDEPTVLEEYNSLVQEIFGILNSYATVLHKIFKEGTGCHNALNAIVQDRILRPCKENEHMMEFLLSIKKISDLSHYKTVEKQGGKDEVVIDIVRNAILWIENIICLFVESVKVLDECQVTDWKKHKGECHQNLKKDLNTTTVNITRHRCANCEKVDLDKQLLVCAKCKYVGYCSKECQVSDWKNHKVDCAFFLKSKYKTIDEIVYNFSREHHDLIDEKVEAARLKTGLDSIELAVDLNFTSSSGEVAPALRSPPEFEVLPASIFWNREKDKAPVNHWFFEDLGGGNTYYSDNDVKKIRQFAASKHEMNGTDYVFYLINFGERPTITVTESGTSRRSKFIKNCLNGLNAINDSKNESIPASERADDEKDCRNRLAGLFDALLEMESQSQL